MGTAWIALGANVGDRRGQLGSLRSALEAEGATLIAVSPEMWTRPLGVRRQPDFRNQVVRAEVAGGLAPLDWLRLCEAAEHAAGRRHTYPWGPRRADADLLLLGAAGEVVVDLPELRVPHPALRERPFACGLLASLDPSLRDPRDGVLLADAAGDLDPRRWGPGG